VGADVGAEVGDEAVDEGHDAEVAVEADLDVVLLLPRMVGGHEVLDRRSSIHCTGRPSFMAAHGTTRSSG
jgi:hypothetical protein